jgi:hypothetical protein
MGITVKNQNLIQREIRWRLILSNTCYHSMENVLSSCLLSKNVKIRKYKIIILPVILNGCETSSVSLKEGHRLREYENGLLRRIFGPRRDEVAGGWRKLHDEELHNLYPLPSIIRMLKSWRLI